MSQRGYAYLYEGSLGEEGDDELGNPREELDFRGVQHTRPVTTHTVKH